MININEYFSQYYYSIVVKGCLVPFLAYQETAKSHVSLLMQINYPILFGTMSQSLTKIVPVVFELCA